MFVTLTSAEMLEAEDVADERQYEASRSGRRSGFAGGHDLELRRHRFGAYGEAAVSKGLGIPWLKTVNTFHRGPPDVGEYEVRTRSDEKYTDLIIRRDDQRIIRRKFIGVLAHDMPRFELTGWIVGTDAQRDEWFHNYGKNRSGCWWVKVADQHDMSELPEYATRPHASTF